ncbi:uncharacterized protein LOC132293399 isoform X2 [Cornus florida]|uniref:uncharacterized protein LOC132293399 isoform X2 n=1 Tax=Cornus florida TaxID=4283 RepID=UPI00289664EF|nr:uncharacterized protein LOC132293399 isoform X2 [Cornus florida]
MLPRVGEEKENKSQSRTHGLDLRGMARICGTCLSWHDKAMLFEQYHWKKALGKKQPYKFKWNQYMDKNTRDSYYINWPVYFP